MIQISDFQSDKYSIHHKHRGAGQMHVVGEYSGCIHVDSTLWTFPRFYAQPDIYCFYFLRGFL